jgi:hypothetical protein
MATVVERVETLEETLQQFIRSVGASQLRTEAELRDFKGEMREFKEEMRGFKQEMQAFKQEMREFKEEGRRQNREMNRRWGELANKMGTLVEDLVAPSLSRIVHEVLGEDVRDLSVRRTKHLADGRSRECDAIAVTDSVVCLNSTKSTLRSADVDRLIGELAEFREFFPEYANYPLIGMLASLAVEDSVLNYAEKQGFVVLGVGDELMEVKNRAGFVPKRW